jgi:hypothetical protein
MEQSDNKVIGWIDLGEGYCKCPNCNAEFYNGKIGMERMTKAFPFCPKCYARMEGENADRD